MAQTVVGAPKPPVTVMAYGPAHVIWNVAFALARGGEVEALQLVFSLLIPIAVAIGLWRRGKPGWIIGLVLAALALFLGVGNLLRGGQTEGVVQVVGSLVMLGLLLAPSTRRWCT
jgi:hypothetical protein